MKWFFTALFTFFFSFCFAQTNYWQQYLKFKIDVSLDPKKKSLTGNESLVYINHSPDTLRFIWFHLYPNAYKNKSTALFQQISNDSERTDKLDKITYGSVSGLNFTVNGEAAETEPHPNPQYIDIVKLMLPAPLPPNDSITIETPFSVKLPSYFSRSGFADGEFMMCQWYPKPAVFDKNGWHEMPYLDMGEFYSEYASYDVNVTVPSDMVVGATGVLQNEDELQAYKSIGKANAANRNSKPQFYKTLTKESLKKLAYHADSVPDFAFFADKNFVIEYDTLALASGKVIDVFTYHHNIPNTPWRSSTEYVKDAVQHYSRWVGEYQYPVVQAVEGPKNNSSGGMEYPMITLITAPDAKAITLDNVITHEVGHNWFMSMLGTNERQHAWMDEGLNTYFEFRYMAEKYRSNLILGDMIPAEMKNLDEPTFQAAIYNAFLQMPTASAIETPSADFTGSQEYAITVYVKTAEWMYLLESVAGEAAVDSAFQNYFAEWHNKHPQPEDMEHSFEEVMEGRNLEKFFALLHKKERLTEGEN